VPATILVKAMAASMPRASRAAKADHMNSAIATCLHISRCNNPTADPQRPPLEQTIALHTHLARQAESSPPPLHALPMLSVPPPFPRPACK
jgi:hypothetical protein